MKFPKLFKRAAAVLMAAVTTLSVLPATTAFAAGDIGTISFTHTYDRNGNAIRYNSSDVFDGYTAGGAGKYHYRMPNWVWLMSYMKRKTLVLCHDCHVNLHNGTL